MLHAWTAAVSLLIVVPACCFAGPENPGWRTEAATQADANITWAQRFCRSPGNEFFCEVPADFIREGFNLIDIGKWISIPHYKTALTLLLTPLAQLGDSNAAAAVGSAVVLYGLIHARYILTPPGQDELLRKLSDASFGCCPRVSCCGQAVLPVGPSDLPLQGAVCVFCPRCWGTFRPADCFIAYDGAYWGTTAAHLLLLERPEVVPIGSGSPTSPPVPSVFGFKLHRSAEAMRRHHAEIEPEIADKDRSWGADGVGHAAADPAGPESGEGGPQQEEGVLGDAVNATRSKSSGGGGSSSSSGSAAEGGTQGSANAAAELLFSRGFSSNWFS